MHRTFILLVVGLLSLLPGMSATACGLALPTSQFVVRSYEGGCENGMASGHGVSVIEVPSARGMMVLRHQGRFVGGVAHGQGRIDSLDGLMRFVGEVRNWQPFEGLSREGPEDSFVVSEFRSGRQIYGGGQDQQSSLQRKFLSALQSAVIRAAQERQEESYADRINREGAERTRAMQAQFDRDGQVRRQQEQQQAASTAAENRWRQEQAQRNLAAANAESARQLAESQRAYEEAQRRRAQEDRLVQERMVAEQRAAEARVAEQNRQNAIAAAESNRRAEEETRRQQAEYERQAQLRRDAERQQALATAAENQRREAQAARDLAAANAESARKLAENQRAYEEAQRRMAEQDRMAKEKLAADERAAQVRLAEQNRQNALLAAEANRKSAEETRRRQAEYDREAEVRREAERRQVLATAAENERRQEQAARDLAAANAESSRKLAENQRSYEESQKRLAEQDRISREKVATDERAAQARLAEQVRQNAISSATANQQAAAQTRLQQAEYDRQAAIRKAAELQQAETTAAQNKANQDVGARGLAAQNAESQRLLGEHAKQYEAQKRAEAASATQMQQANTAVAQAAERERQAALASLSAANRSAPAPQGTGYTQGQVGIEASPWPKGTPYPAVQSPVPLAATPTIGSRQAVQEAAPFPTSSAARETEQASIASLQSAERERIAALALLSAANRNAPNPQASSYTQKGQVGVQSNPWPTGTPYPTVQASIVAGSTPIVGSRQTVPAAAAVTQQTVSGSAAVAVIGSRSNVASEGTVSPSIPSFATPAPVQGIQQLGPALPTPGTSGSATNPNPTLANTLIVGSVADRSGNANSTPMLSGQPASTAKPSVLSPAAQAQLDQQTRRIWQEAGAEVAREVFFAFTPAGGVRDIARAEDPADYFLAVLSSIPALGVEVRQATNLAQAARSSVLRGDFSQATARLPAIRAEMLRLGNIVQVNGRSPRNAIKYASKNYFDELPDALKVKYPRGVTFSAEGFPNFAPYARIEKEMSGLNGICKHDELLANRLVGLASTPAGWVWHHVEGGSVMQLVPLDLHRAISHTGGAAQLRGCI